MRQQILNIRLDLDHPDEYVFHRISTDTYLQKGRNTIIIRPDYGDSVEDWEEVLPPTEE